MSAKDLFHDTVKTALIKEGWIITDDPLRIKVGGVEMYIDLGAEMLIGAQKENQKIAVEVKSFVGNSAISEFHSAIGQFIDYRIALEEKNLNRILYLAIPSAIYESFFSLQFIQVVIEKIELNLIIYDPDQEVIIQWIN